MSAEVDSDRESDQSSDDERADGSDTDTDAAHGRGRPRTRQNGLRPRRPERKSLDKGMWDFLHMVREKGEGGRYTAVRTLLAPVKPIRSALASRTGDGEQGEHGAEKTDLEGELVEEGIIEPAERRGSRLQVESVEGDDNGSSVDLRIERNLTTAVKRSELLIEGFADVVRQIEDANVGDHKKDELLEEVLDRMPPEGPFELP